MAATKDAVYPTEERDAGAVSHEEEQWYGTDWYQANRDVRRLQIRIVKATKEGRWGKVKALQRLLTHSYNGKLLAVKRVTENQGRNTPGVDGITWNTPEKRMAAVHMLKQRGYHPLPLKRVYIPKKNGKMRPLGIPVMKCRAMQALYLLALDPIAETTGDPNSYGFRSQRSTADAIGQCFCALAKRASAQWILEGHIQATAGHLVCQLNRVIRGWARYHRHVVSKATFNSVQRSIYQALWRWARRRHPHKGARWVKQKYFCSVRQRNWVFFGEVPQQEEITRVYLTWITDTPIERHIKIKESANPYDPAWETYFEKRLDLKMERTLRKRRLLLHLWEEQHGICPHCQQKLTELTGWHSHHIVWRSKGGSDGAANRVLLHPDCHRAIHSQGLSVTKPCPTTGASERLEPDE